MPVASITRRKLAHKEVDLLIVATKSFPDLSYVSKSRWLSFSNPYLIFIKGEFAGVCMVYQLIDWVKIGPLVILLEFQGRGCGKALLKRIISDYPNKNIFVSSSNLKLKKIVLTFGFQKAKSFFALPFEIKLFLFKQLFDYLSLKYILETARKFLFLKRSNYEFFLLSNRQS